MKNSPLIKPHRMIIAVLSALLPLAAAQAADDPYEGSTQQYQEQQLRGSQGPMRSDSDAATPTYSGEDRRQFQSETPGAEGPTRSEMDTYRDDRTMSMCPNSPSEKTAPNAYYGESNPFYSEQSRQAFLGKGRWC